MISRVYISHSKHDEGIALELSRALWRVGLESYAAMNRLSPGISRAERVSFGIRNSECMVALLTSNGSASTTVCQEIGLARGVDLLIIPLLEKDEDKENKNDKENRNKNINLPFLIEHLKPIAFSRSEFRDAVGQLIKTLRDLSSLDWLKVTCPKCGEEMTQYMTPQEDVDEALQKGSCLETICSYCQNRVSLDPRTFEPIVK